jgi:hypothetical protein
VQQQSSRAEQEVIGTRLWPAAALLCRWLLGAADEIQGCSILELGAGTGACGLFAGALGAAHVTLTDGGGEEVFTLLQHNAAANRHLLRQGAVVRELCFGDWRGAANLGAGVGWVLAADVLYGQASSVADREGEEEAGADARRGKNRSAQNNMEEEAGGDARCGKDRSSQNKMEEEAGADACCRADALAITLDTLLASPAERTNDPSGGTAPAARPCLSPSVPLIPLTPSTPGARGARGACLRPRVLLAHEHRDRSLRGPLAWDADDDILAYFIRVAAERGLRVSEIVSERPAVVRRDPPFVIWSGDLSLLEVERAHETELPT